MGKEEEQKPTPLEIERKFLIKELPNNIADFPHKEIIQGYLAIVDNGTEVRLRKKGDKCYETVKSGGTKIRTEIEVEITPQQFEKLWPLTEWKRIEKTRYELPLGDNLIIELDVYHGILQNLITAEVEFPTEAASSNFIAPSWFEDDVTNDVRFKNQYLAIYGIPSYCGILRPTGTKKA